jgi:Family of unknown function (DUF6272)
MSPESNMIVMSFSGNLTRNLIEELGESIKRELELNESSKKLSFLVFSVFIEQIVNIMEYHRDTQDMFATHNIKPNAMTIIKSKPGQFMITSGSTILASDIPALKATLDKLSTMDKTMLTTYYRKQLKRTSTECPSVNNANLGLIAIARKVSKPLNYTFNSVNQHEAFFTLETTLEA